MLRKTINFLNDETGATAVEYGLIVSLVSLGAFVALTAYGASISSIFEHVSGVIDAAIARRF